MTAAAKTLAEALVAAQAEMPAVEKDATNPHFKSRFTSLDHLIAKTRPVLTRHGLAITQWPTSVDGLPALRTKVTHVSGDSDEDTMVLLLGKQDMQGLGGAITYAKRYMWAAVCAVSTDEDDDGNAASTPAVAKPATKEKTPEGVAGLSTEDLVKTHDRLAGDWGKLEAGFVPGDAVKKRFEKLAKAKAAGDPEPYRKWLTEQIGGYGVMIKEREAQASAAEKFPIPASAQEAA